MEQTVSCIGPATLQDHEPEALRTCIVGVLDQLSKQRASIAGVLVDICQEGLDRLDFVKRASDDAGLGPDINVGEVLFVCALVHEIRGMASVAQD